MHMWDNCGFKYKGLADIVKVACNPGLFLLASSSGAAHTVLHIPGLMAGC